MNETINQFELEIAEMRVMIAYYEKRIAQKEIAIYEHVQSLMCRKIITQDQIIEAKEVGLYEMVKEILNTKPEGIDFRNLKARCLNLHPEMYDKICQQIWSVCNNLAKRGFKINMPEKKQKGINRVFNEKAITNGSHVEFSIGL